MKLVLIIIENLEYVDIVRGFLEDFYYMYGIKDVEKIYKDKIKFYCLFFFCIVGVERILLCMNVIFKEYFVVLLEVVSIIGVGDNFNVGLIYGMLKYDVWYCDL